MNKTQFLTAIFVVVVIAFMFTMAACDMAKGTKGIETEVKEEVDEKEDSTTTIRVTKINDIWGAYAPAVTSVEYNGHEFIVAYSRAGVDIEHSPSCKCYSTD